jgi:hypothetical protein
VLGSGIDVMYPREHADLARQLLDLGGAVISESPPGTPPESWRFPAPKPYKHIEGWSQSVEWACDASRGVIMRGLFRIEGLSSQITGELAPSAGSGTVNPPRWCYRRASLCAVSIW